MKFKLRLKVLLTIIWVFLVLDLGYYFNAYQINAFLFAKLVYTKSRTPELYIVPETRTVQNEIDKVVNRTEITRYGLTFKSPWGEVISEKSATSLTSMKFQDDKSLLVRDKYPAGLAEGLKNQLLTESELALNKNPKSKQRLLEFIEKYGLTSDYELDNRRYSISPNQIRLDSSKMDAVVDFLLLTQKTVFAPGLTQSVNKIYRFDTGTFKGFQLNSQYSNDRESINIILFDQEDNEYIIMMSAGTVTQEDIDIVLASLQEDPEYVSKNFGSNSEEFLNEPSRLGAD